MALSNIIQSLEDQLVRKRTLLTKLESGEMYCGTFSSPSTRERETEEWIKEIKDEIAKTKANLRELKALK